MKLDRTLTSTVYVVNGNKVLLHMHKKYKTLFALGGHMMADELPQDTAIREVFEESGLKIELVDCNTERYLGSVREIIKPRHILLENIGKDVENIDFIFFATTEDTNLNPQYGESKQLYWLGKEEIEDNKSIKPHVKQMALEALEVVSNESK